MSAELRKTKDLLLSQGNLATQAEFAPDSPEKVGAIRALLVESDADTRRLLKSVLGQRGHTIRVCRDGQTAWNAYRKNPYDLVILGGWRQADMHSLKFCRKIRTHEAGSRSVILVVGPVGQPELLQMIVAAGADDILPTPLSAELLQLRLAFAERLLAVQQGARGGLVTGGPKQGTRIRGRLDPNRRRRLLQETQIINIESALRESEDRYRAVVESFPGFIFLVNRNGNILDLDLPSYLMDLPEILVTSHIHEFVCQEDRDLFKRELERCWDTGGRHTFEVRNFNQSLTYQVLLAHIKPGEEGRREAMVCSMYDITDRRRAEEALAAERELLATTLRGIGDAVVAINLEGAVVLMNQSAERLTGIQRADALGRPVRDLLKVVDEASGKRFEIPPPVDEFRQQGMLIEHQSLFLLREDESIPVSSRVTSLVDQSSNLVGMVVTLHDTTDKRRWEKETRQAQKLEAMSVLAGGLAHDFNNFLMQIMLNVSTARMKITNAPVAQEILASAERAVKHAKGITQQLLTFSRGGQPVKSRQLLNPLLKESVKFVLRGSPLTPEFLLQKDLWAVDIDANQINQVINNLVINAIQAMPGGGKLFVSTANLTVDEDRPQSPLMPGNYVRVMVRDRGTGIAPELVGKIFDPYFTTKERGNGLGLYSCFNVLTKHGGWITVKSKVNRGSSFIFYLPGKVAPVPITATKRDLTKGHGHVLIMDDDDDIRRALARLLVMQGYNVDTASEGEAAIRLYVEKTREGKPFDLVILDLTIVGGMGGLETFKKIKQINPKVKAIAASGYSNDPIMANYEDHGFHGVIPKPFTWDEMSWVLTKVMNQPAE